MNKRQALIAGGGALAIAGAGLGAVGLRSARADAMEAYAAAAAAMRARLAGQPALKDIVRLAALAANGHNTQPWWFRLGEGRIEIRPDFTRRTPVVDPDDHHLFASLGCAAENLAIAAAAAGLRGDVRFDPSGEGGMVFEFAAGPVARSPLLKAITRRQSTRTEYDDGPVDAAALATLAAAAREPGVELIVLTSRRRIEPLVDLVVAGNSAQMADRAFLRELKHWLRFDPRQAMALGDGLFSAASGNPVLPAWLAGPVFDLAFSAGTENDKYARHLRSSAGVAVFVSERDEPAYWARAGRACQRFALQATALGLQHAFVNQAVEVAAVRKQLAAHLGLGERRPRPRDAVRPRPGAAPLAAPAGRAGDPSVLGARACGRRAQPVARGRQMRPHGDAAAQADGALVGLARRLDAIGEGQQFGTRGPVGLIARDCFALDRVQRHDTGRRAIGACQRAAAADRGADAGPQCQQPS